MTNTPSKAKKTTDAIGDNKVVHTTKTESKLESDKKAYETQIKVEESRIKIEESRIKIEESRKYHSDIESVLSNTPKKAMDRSADEEEDDDSLADASPKRAKNAAPVFDLSDYEEVNEDDDSLADTSPKRAKNAAPVSKVGKKTAVVKKRNAAKHRTSPKYGMKDPPKAALTNPPDEGKKSPAMVPGKYASPAKTAPKDAARAMVVGKYAPPAARAMVPGKYASPAKTAPKDAARAMVSEPTKEELVALLSRVEKPTAKEKKAALDTLAAYPAESIDHWPIPVLEDIAKKLGFSDYEFRNLKKSLKWRRQRHLDSKN
eukprot:scaffold4442_cov125-Amphora_coffeaeformis.AAC.11